MLDNMYKLAIPYHQAQPYLDKVHDCSMIITAPGDQNKHLMHFVAGLVEVRSCRRVWIDALLQPPKPYA